MSKILIKNAHILDRSEGLDLIGDILVENGLIVGIDGMIEAEDAEVIDATGLYAAPGFIDMHVHLRDPGYTQKEDIYSGCEAAAAGGFTAVACMPNTSPVADSIEIINYINNKSQNAKCRVYPVASITKELYGIEMTDFEALKDAGTIAFSDDGRPVESARIMQDAMEKANSIGSFVISHCEDMGIISNGIVNKGMISKILNVPGMDRTSEDCVTAREIALAGATDTRVHIAHVSTKGSVALIMDAKRRGIRVTAETCPHYFILTEDELLKRDANYRMNPPLRTSEDRQAILSAVANGTIDCIVTDHAPHTAEDKAEFTTAPNGIIGLETSFALCNTYLVDRAVIPLQSLIYMMSTRPAQILGVDGGHLRVGGTADIVLFDTNESWTIDASKFKSRARNTPFDGMTVKGRVKYTILKGQISYQDTEQPETEMEIEQF